MLPGSSAHRAIFAQMVSRHLHCALNTLQVTPSAPALDTLQAFNAVLGSSGDSVGIGSRDIIDTSPSSTSGTSIGTQAGATSPDLARPDSRSSTSSVDSEAEYFRAMFADSDSDSSLNDECQYDLDLSHQLDGGCTITMTNDATLLRDLVPTKLEHVSP